MAATASLNNNKDESDTLSKKKKNVQTLPGVVALAALGLALVVKAIVPSDMVPALPGDAVVTDATMVNLVEAVACLASYVYTSVLDRQRPEDSSY